jgi:hypothetical protein
MQQLMHYNHKKHKKLIQTCKILNLLDYAKLPLRVTQRKKAFSPDLFHLTENLMSLSATVIYTLAFILHKNLQTSYSEQLEESQYVVGVDLSRYVALHCQSLNDRDPVALLNLFLYVRYIIYAEVILILFLYL